MVPARSKKMKSGGVSISKNGFIASIAFPG